MEKERRQHKRVEANVGTAMLNKENGKYVGKAKIVDISTGGLKLETPLKMNIGDRIVLNFVLSKREYISSSGLSVTGEVEAVWKMEKEKIAVYGVKFIDLSVIDRERIREYVNFKERENESFI